MKKLQLLLLFPLVLMGCQTKPNDAVKSEPTAFENPPEWSKQAIWYQIFVERFRNGDASNDPTPEDIKGAYPGNIPEGWHVTPWTHDWYADDDYIVSNPNITDENGNKLTTFGQKSQLRRYGGDLQGVLDKVDYLDSLGITAVFFNPLNDSPSLHKYDARYWRHIDRNFGPNPQKDIEIISNEINDDAQTWKYTTADSLFLQVVDAFHQKGIKVIMDYSWNHTGSEFWAWKDVLKNQEQSKYKDWYWVNKFDDPKTDENEFDYRGWFGVASLPEIRETQFVNHSDSIVPFEGNLYSEAVKLHIFSICKRWLDPNNDGDPSDGVDGFRLDVAAEVPLGFWRDYRKFVRSINPDAYLVGEVWWEKWPDKLLNPEPFVRGDVFDAPMNYRWFREARHFFNASPDSVLVSSFVNNLQQLNNGLREQSLYAMMNLNASHDVPRILTSLYNKNMYKYNSKPEQDSTYMINKPDESTYQTLKMLLIHQFTYVGAPHVWAGDEMGMWGADDPSNRKPLIWPDYQFEDEVTHPLGYSRPVDKVAFDHSLFEYYKKLIHLRKKNKALSLGNIKFLEVDNSKQVLVYKRDYNTEEAYALFNTGASSQMISLSLDKSNQYVDALSGEPVEITEEGIANINLKSRAATILIKR